MSTELIQSSIYLTRDQRKFVRSNYINLSKVCRASVDNLIKKSEGQTLREQPTDEPRGFQELKELHWHVFLFYF